MWAWTIFFTRDGELADGKSDGTFGSAIGFEFFVTRLLDRLADGVEAAVFLPGGDP
jgi:hypothetical protein